MDQSRLCSVHYDNLDAPDMGIGLLQTCMPGQKHPEQASGD